MKMSKAAKAAAYDALQEECHVWRELSQLLIENESPDAREVIDCSTPLSDRNSDLVDGEVYEYRLYRVMRAHGGLLVHVHHYPGQRPHVSAELFEGWCRRVEKSPYGIGISTEIKVAMERLAMKRRQMFERAREAV